MRTRTTLTLAVVAALAAAPALAAGPVETFPPAATDLVPETLAPETVIAAVPVAPGVARDPVTFAWAVPSDRPITPPAPHRTASREYWRRVDAAALSSGVEIDTTAPGALIRISPLDDAARAVELRPERIRIFRPDGTASAGESAFLAAAAGADLDTPELAFPPGSAAVRLRPELGSGRLTLRVEGIPSGSTGTYLVHVLDKDSPVVLELTVARDTVLWGGRLEATARLVEGDRALPATVAEARLVAPDGRSYPAAVLRTADGSLRVTAPLDVEPASRPGLWEVHLSASGELDGLPVPRDARTAFALTVATARLTGELRPVAGDGLAMEIGVEVAAAGRYAVSGVLYGRTGDGSMAPLAAVEGAAWLDGDGWIRLEVPRGLLDASALQPPFELRHVVLKDQGRVSVLERRQRGFRLHPDAELLGKPPVR